MFRPSTFPHVYVSTSFNLNIIQGILLKFSLNLMQKIVNNFFPNDFQICYILLRFRSGDADPILGAETSGATLVLKLLPWETFV